MARHWGLAVLLACLTPLYVAFTWQAGLASLGDDSASYLAVAQALAGVNPAVLPWVGYHTHFPPLFPLALAACGAATDLRIAHAVVALCALVSVALVYRFAWGETGRRDAALAVAVAFVACPTAWISAKGILSEPMFLAVSMAALVFHQKFLESGRGSAHDWLGLGLLLAATLLTRIVGLALALALLASLAMRAHRREPVLRARELAAALIPGIVLACLWLVLRPVAAQDSYQRIFTAMARSWMDDVGLMGEVSSGSFSDGWIASFTADAAVGPAAIAITMLAAALALIGLARRLLANRLDAWYVTISLLVVFGWVFSEDNTRRLLYPLLPLLLLYAGETVAWACASVRRAALAPAALAVAAAVLAIACVPALVVITAKALDREPVVAGAETRYADITDYYTTLNVPRARALAARHAVVLEGLRGLRATPAGSRVLWMRPEYAALLAGRPGAAWYYDWEPTQLARTVLAARVEFIVEARLAKTDLAGGRGDAGAPLREVASYARPVAQLANPVTRGVEFTLWQVDPAALRRRLGGN